MSLLESDLEQSQLNFPKEWQNVRDAHDTFPQYPKGTFFLFDTNNGTGKVVYRVAFLDADSKWDVYEYPDLDYPEGVLAAAAKDAGFDLSLTHNQRFLHLASEGH